MEQLISFSEKGLYCAKGNFYIDPWQPVDNAIITHAHSDHAKFGSKHYLCHHQTKPLLQLRLGNQNYQTVAWNEPIYINGVKISLHPAGHIIGSSQIRLDDMGHIWVVTGDYKIENDGLSGIFEPITCNTLVTESTFGLPIFQWEKQEIIFQKIVHWILQNQSKGLSSILLAYSLGKAQRIVHHLHNHFPTIFAHGAIYNTHQTLIQAGWHLPHLQRVLPDTPLQQLKNAVVIAPPSVEGTAWLKKFAPFAIGVCSGWMQVRGNIRRRNIDAGFALSDHADWDGLLQTVKNTSAEKVWVTHGFQAAFSRYITESGIAIGAEVATEYGKEEEPITADLVN